MEIRKLPRAQTVPALLWLFVCAHDIDGSDNSRCDQSLQKVLNRSGASAVQSVVFCSSEPGRWNESGANPKSCETRVITRVLAHLRALPRSPPSKIEQVHDLEELKLRCSKNQVVIVET